MRHDVSPENVTFKNSENESLVRDFGSWVGEAQRDISLTHVFAAQASRSCHLVLSVIYLMQPATRRFFTRRELAVYLTQSLLAAADQRIIRSRPIKGYRVYTYIRGTFVLSRNGIIVRTVARDTSIMPSAPFRGRSRPPRV